MLNDNGMYTLCKKCHVDIAFVGGTGWVSYVRQGGVNRPNEGGETCRIGGEHVPREDTPEPAWQLAQRRAAAPPKPPAEEEPEPTRIEKAKDLAWGVLGIVLLTALFAGALELLGGSGGGGGGLSEQKCASLRLVYLANNNSDEVREDALADYDNGNCERFE